MNKSNDNSENLNFIEILKKSIQDDNLSIDTSKIKSLNDLNYRDIEILQNDLSSLLSIEVINDIQSINK